MLLQSVELDGVKVVTPILSPEAIERHLQSLAQQTAALIELQRLLLVAICPPRNSFTTTAGSRAAETR